eukprot:6180898-Pleurochrysis_carterae.AAC.3
MCVPRSGKRTAARAPTGMHALQERAEDGVGRRRACDAWRKRCFYGYAVLSALVLVRVAKSVGQNNVMAVLVPDMLQDLHLAPSPFGLIFALASLVSSTVQPLGGMAFDRRAAGCES